MKDKQEKSHLNAKIIIGYIILVLIGILLLCSSLTITIMEYKNCPANNEIWLTFIFGCSSFFATLLIGYIAYWQNKNYSLNSLKNEVKSKIQNEKKELLFIYDGIFKISKYLTPFESVYLLDNEQISKIKYDLDLIRFKESLLPDIIRFQFCEFTPNSMLNNVKQMLKMEEKTQTTYEQLKKNYKYEDLINKDIEEINTFLSIWINEFTGIRNATFIELDNLCNEISQCKTMFELEKLILFIQQGTASAKKACEKLIDEWTNKLTISKDKNK